MNFNIAEKEIAVIVTRLFESPELTQFPYHNLSHTQGVVAHAREIAAYYLLNEPDTFIVTAAAWFHDIGHLYGEMQEHEEKGVQVMQHYLKNILPDTTRAIAGCIMATKYPTHPNNLHEQILCDADTYHIGTALFRHTDELVEKEMEIRTGRKYPRWHENSLAFLKQHVFFTEYCQQLLAEGKKQNIAWLESPIPTKTT